MTSELSGIVLFVIPGFLGYGLFYFLIPNRRLSDFERLVLSLVFSCIAYVGIYAAHRACIIPDASYASWFGRDAGIADFIRQGKFWVVPLAILVALLEGTVLAVIIRDPEFSKILSMMGIELVLQPTVWNQVLEEYKAFSFLIETSRETYIGRVKYYTIDPNEPSELFLHDKAFAVEFDQTTASYRVKRVLPSGLYLHSKDILALAPIHVQAAAQNLSTTTSSEAAPS